MCSSGGEVAQTDEQLQQAQAAMTQTLNADYSTTFAEQQSVAKQQMAIANNLIANPQGYSPQFLAQQTTAISQNTATSARQALSAASAFAASHGGAADTGGGGIAQIAGQIGAAATAEKDSQLSSLATANANLKQENYWKGIGELNNAGSNLGGVAGTAIGSSAGVAGSSTGAGSGALAAQQAGWQDVGGIISGVAGLATAASGFNWGGGAAPSGTTAPSGFGNPGTTTSVGNSYIGNAEDAGYS